MPTPYLFLVSTLSLGMVESRSKADRVHVVERQKASAVSAPSNLESRHNAAPIHVAKHTALANAVSDIRSLKRNISNVFQASESEMPPSPPPISRCLANGPAALVRRGLPVEREFK
jgi:hypothetical protein